jgi:hypothetical protein
MVPEIIDEKVREIVLEILIEQGLIKSPQKVRELRLKPQ